ncbi:formin-like protein 16 [Setaria italica]|uniref:formin-like protein 16 n=1 Tax=Setaria italica TaxID=4555 RepID=UPI000350DA1E|nr:formin-like protein 16 [Setaria italica]
MLCHAGFTTVPCSSTDAGATVKVGRGALAPPPPQGPPSGSAAGPCSSAPLPGPPSRTATAPPPLRAAARFNVSTAPLLLPPPCELAGPLDPPDPARGGGQRRRLWPKHGPTVPIPLLPARIGSACSPEPSSRTRRPASR